MVSPLPGQHVQYDYEHLVFGHYRVHKNTKCAFRPSKAEPFMDIGSIWYMQLGLSGCTLVNRPSNGNEPFEDVFPIENGYNYSIAMLVYKRVCAFVLRSCVIARIVIESGIHGMLNLRG